MGQSDRYLAFGSGSGNQNTARRFQELRLLGLRQLETGPQIADKRQPHEEELIGHSPAAASRGELAASARQASFPQPLRKNTPMGADGVVSAAAYAREHADADMWRRLDAQMNNTSLILLFTGARQALFSRICPMGNNWSYQLSNRKSRETQIG